MLGNMVRFLLLTMLLLIAGSSPAAFAQFSSTPAFLTTSVVEDQIATGRYQDAIQLLDSSLHRERAFGPSTSSEFAGLYASLGRALVEIGELNQADKILKDAESTSQDQFNSLWEPIILRDRAALSLARREYAEAAKIAGKAYTESIQGGGHHGVGSIRGIRASYCQSIQAEAELRLGNTARAARIISAALRPITKKERKEPFYAPRILYAACRVASHQGNYPQAKEYCRRGLAW